MSQLRRSSYSSNTSAIDDVEYYDPTVDSNITSRHGLLSCVAAVLCCCDRRSDFTALIGAHDVDEASPPKYGRAVHFRRIGLATLFITAGLVAVAQWSAVASGVVMLEELGNFPSSTATSLTAAFFAMYYLFTLVAGVLSETSVGTLRVLQGGLAVAVIGSVVASILASPLVDTTSNIVRSFFVIAIFVACAGIGACQSTVPSLLGDQCYDKAPSRLATSYTVFYFVIQLCAFSTRLVFPVTRRKGWWVALTAFLSAPCLVAFLIVTAFRHAIVERRVRTAEGERSLLARSCHVLYARLRGSSALEDVRERYGGVFVTGILTSMRVVRLHLALPIFWAIYFQMFELWFLQAKQLDKRIGSDFSVSADQVNMLSPLLDMFLLALFTAGKTAVGYQWGVTFRPRGQIVAGYVAAVLAFVAATTLQYALAQWPSHTPTIWLQVPQYALVCIAEVMVYPAALQQVYDSTPSILRGLAQSFLWFYIGVGNTINAVVMGALGESSEASPKELLPIFYAYTATMVGAAMLNAFLFIVLDPEAADSRRGEIHPSREPSADPSHSPLLTSTDRGASEPRPLAPHAGGINAGGDTQGQTPPRLPPNVPSYVPARRNSSTRPTYYSTRRSPVREGRVDVSSGELARPGTSN